MSLHTRLKLIEKQHISRMKVKDVTVDDGQQMCRDIAKAGYAYTTITTIKQFMSAVFCYAIETLELMIKNPFSFRLDSVISKEKHQRTALSVEDETNLMEFMKTDKIGKKYYDTFFVILHTGLRISEYVGLREEKINFDTNEILIDHQLIYAEQGFEYISPKTKAGVRTIFMTEEVKEALRRIIEHAHQVDKGYTIDGYSGFIELSSRGNPRRGTDLGNRLRSIVNRYNETHEKPLPEITPHVLRHTFCTRMSEAGMKDIAIQYLMGHSNIQTTSLYTHASLPIAKEEFFRLQS